MSIDEIDFEILGEIAKFQKRLSKEELAEGITWIRGILEGSDEDKMKFIDDFIARRESKACTFFERVGVTAELQSGGIDFETPPVAWSRECRICGILTSTFPVKYSRPPRGFRKTSIWKWISSVFREAMQYEPHSKEVAEEIFMLVWRVYGAHPIGPQEKYKALAALRKWFDRLLDLGPIIKIAGLDLDPYLRQALRVTKEAKTPRPSYYPHQNYFEEIVGQIQDAIEGALEDVENLLEVKEEMPKRPTRSAGRPRCVQRRLLLFGLIELFELANLKVTTSNSSRFVNAFSDLWPKFGDVKLSPEGLRSSVIRAVREYTPNFHQSLIERIRGYPS